MAPDDEDTKGIILRHEWHGEGGRAGMAVWRQPRTVLLSVSSA